jgi:PhoPQ-activated pathogenicity-related protein
MLVSKCFVIKVLFVLVCILSTQVYAGTKTHSILEKFVKSGNDVFSYEAVSTIPLSGSTAHIYKMKSQDWRKPSEVDRTGWEHRMTVVVPDDLRSKKAIVFIFGGENTPDFLKPNPGRLGILATFANQTGSVAIQVSQIPNQPLVFADEPDDGRTEDGLVAYSFDTAMGLNDYTWTAYLPMTKAVVKAMDAVQMIAEDLKLAKKPKDFVLAGFSKRGAITWLTAAVDTRVCAISPGVYDTLNFIPSIENQRKTYGAFNDSLRDYVLRNVLDRLRINEGQELIDVVDPYAYRDRVNIPKYIINAAGDEFYPPDSSLHYIDSLKGETLLRYVPNTNHGGSNGGFESSLQGLLAWYSKIVNEIPRPKIKWETSPDNTLKVSINSDDATAVLWSATNISKDFRLMTFGPNWHATPVPISSDGKVDIPLNVPESGWSGYFVEISTQDNPELVEKYTTPVIVLPTTDPFSLEQPTYSPKSKTKWQELLADIISGSIENSKLVNSFPIRNIGNKTVLTLTDAYELLIDDIDSNEMPALQECLVTRLNIKDGQLGWYSIPNENGSLSLWKWWNYADYFYRAKMYSVSEYICASMNS